MIDFSDEATASFIRKTLCSQKIQASGYLPGDGPSTVKDVLPPLTSSNAVDLQLYAFIAIIVRDSVQPWYSKITPDQVFLDEVVRIIAHATRAIEQRLRKVDLEGLLLDEIPALLDAHITGVTPWSVRTGIFQCADDNALVIAYRLAQEAALSPTIHAAPRQIYAALRPHPALDPAPLDYDGTPRPEQLCHDSKFRRLVSQGVLAVLLPTEDLQNPCLFALVSEILADLLLGNFIGGRLCETEFLFRSIQRACEATQTQTGRKSWVGAAQEEPEQDWLKRYGLLAEQDGIARTNQRNRWHSTTEYFWTICHYTLMACMALQTIMTMILLSPSLPPRTAETTGTPAHSPPNSSPAKAGRQRVGQEASEGAKGPPISTAVRKPALVSVSLWTALSKLFSLQDRMPWLVGACTLVWHVALTGPGKVGRTDGRIDR